MNLGRYGDYNVLNNKENWDHPTRQIVLRRTEKPSHQDFFNDEEASTLTAALRHLLYEHRRDILLYVTAGMAQKLGNPYGEAQRDPQAPPQAELIRRGLGAINHQAAQDEDGSNFSRLTPSNQLQILSALQQGHLPVTEFWKGIPQKQLFKKILGLAVDAYYSHPTIWSEIGYAGPVYPQSYVRIELGLTDPWEARKP